MALFWSARNATKNGFVFKRPGTRFKAPKIITKGAKISRKFSKKWHTKSRLEHQYVHGEMQIALEFSWLAGPIEIVLRYGIVFWLHPWGGRI
jgi:hypothetical protein